MIFLALLSLCPTLSHALLTPKILGKFSTGYIVGSENKSSYKLGGALFFELEFISFLSGGLFLGIHNATINRLAITTDEPQNDKRATVKASLFDAGFYLKPQLPISLIALTLTPYISLGIGIPSFTAIRSEHKERSKNNLALSQYYSLLAGLDLTLGDHWVVLAEAGFSSNVRLIKPSLLLFPLTFNVGVGYRF